jgi:hypothetical protein
MPRRTDGTRGTHPTLARPSPLKSAVVTAAGIEIVEAGDIEDALDNGGIEPRGALDPVVIA